MKKRNLISTIGMVLVVAFVGLGLVTFTSCEKPRDPEPENPIPDPGEDPEEPDEPDEPGTTLCDSWAYLIDETPQEYMLEGNTFTYGDHVYTVNGEIYFDSIDHDTPTAYVTFTNIPSGVTEFTAVYENLLGLSPQGAAAMVPMAIELYARDAAVGKDCLNVLCNNSSTVFNIVNVLSTKFNHMPYDPNGTAYLQRYLPAAVLKDASYLNGYAPSEPYTVEMCSHPNGIQDAPQSGGTAYFTYIFGYGGWDIYRIPIHIFQTYGSDMYTVSNCSSAYLQCKNIQNGPWQGLK